MEVGIRELRNELSRWLALVREGEEIVITERGRPVARLVGVTEAGGLDRLVAAGLIQLPSARRRSARSHPSGVGSRCFRRRLRSGHVGSPARIRGAGAGLGGGTTDLTPIRWSFVVGTYVSAYA